jgi:hypothetical protein
VQVNKEEKKETKVMLTKPLQLAKESDSEESYRAPNLLQRLLSLFKNVRPGSDLTRFQVCNILFLFIYLFFGSNNELKDQNSQDILTPNFYLKS